MLPGQASQTLLIASIMRARHQLFDAPVVLDDPVVLKLVPEAQDPGVLTEFGESRASMASLMRSMFAVRSRFTEDRLARAAARGVRQYVMFGAGLDTFPWRQPDFAKDMQIFAVDHPASLIQTNHGDTNFGVTSLAAPNAASSSLARYSLVVWLTAWASSSLLHCFPGIDRCLLASATIKLASTAKPSPPTRPAAIHAPTTRSKTLRKMPLSRKRSLRARENAE